MADSWLDRLNRGETASDAMVAMYTEVQGALRRLEFAAVESILARADTKHMSEEAMSGLLRYSLPLADHGPAWYVFLDQVYSELEGRGVDAEHRLRGIL